MAKKKGRREPLLKSEATAATLQQWLEEKWPRERRKCPMCDHANWTVAEDVVLFMPLSKGGGISLGSGYPQVLVTCTNCAYTHLFNAAQMGLTSKPQKQEPTDG